MLSRGVARFAPRVVSSRLAHTDKHFPDLAYYREKAAPMDGRDFMDAQIEEKELKKAHYYALNSLVVSSAAWMGANVLCKAVNLLNPTMDITSRAIIEMELAHLEPGDSGIFIWRGKPVFVKHRTAEDIAREESVDVSELRDKQHDSERVVDKNWLVVIGVCTHLGCVPIDNAGEFNGYYCPCHGSHYDGSGRIRKGPAPLNLEVPHYKFTDPTTILVG
jgi:ubiquinol-cytochrome c reductase iron-sulfur subunit